MFQKPAQKILEEADKIQNSEERAEYMKKNMRPAVAKVLAIFHNENIEFEKFKNVIYNTKHNKAGISDSTLDHEIKRLYIFQKKSPLDPDRKKVKLIQILESMHAEESDFVFNNLIQKKNPFKNLNKNFIKKYFPKILETSIDRN
jgi:hypothetical protein